MQFANGIEINLGREDFTERLQRFVDIYPRILASQSDKIAVVDLRYTNGFAVRWTNSPKPALTTPSVTRAIVPMHLMYHQAATVTNSAS
jgi:cell division septal protein FtsQ